MVKRQNTKCSEKQHRGKRKTVCTEDGVCLWAHGFPVCSVPGRSLSDNTWNGFAREE